MHLLVCYTCMRAVQICMHARTARHRNIGTTVTVTNRLKTINLCIAPIDYLSIAYVCIAPIDYFWLGLKIATLQHRYRRYMYRCAYRVRVASGRCGAHVGLDKSTPAWPQIRSRVTMRACSPGPGGRLPCGNRGLIVWQPAGHS